MASHSDTPTFSQASKRSDRFRIDSRRVLDLIDSTYQHALLHFRFSFVISSFLSILDLLVSAQGEREARLYAIQAITGYKL